MTILTRRPQLATDAQFSHYYGCLEQAIRALPELEVIPNATAVSMTGDSVTYTDETGQTHTVTGDTVVACGGMTPLQEEALAFDRAADRFFAIGDCSRVGNLHTCTRGAFSAAAQI